MSADLVAGIDAIPHPSDKARSGLPAKYPDCRPAFLNLSQKQLKNSKDHEARPVITITDAGQLPWCAGYAETINGGKSAFVNEDNAAYHHEILEVATKDPKSEEERKHQIEMWYFGVFDGHAGEGAAIFAAKNCHRHVIMQLKTITHLLVKEGEEVYAEEEDGPLGPSAPPVSKVTLIKGALETAFLSMDEQIKRERATYLIKGGCTAIAAVFLLGKIFVVNAGDSRSVLYRRELKDSSPSQEITHAFNMEVVPMSFDFTPETDRSRLQYIALLQPKLLRGLFGRIQWQRRLRKRDLDKRVLCRDAHMEGWAFRTVTEEDIGCAPMLAGEGKRSRLLATIGTSRGFGDHDLVGPGDVHIKPFLTPAPEVRVYDLNKQHSKDDVLVIASDGLWERLTSEDAAEVVNNWSKQMKSDDTSRYTTIAQQLVLAARGNLTAKGWRTSSDLQASYDDITVFVVPLHVHNPPKPADTMPTADESDRISSPPASNTETATDQAHVAPGDRTELPEKSLQTAELTADSGTGTTTAGAAVGSTEMRNVLEDDSHPGSSMLAPGSSLIAGGPASPSVSLGSFVLVDNDSDRTKQ